MAAENMLIKKGILDRTLNEEELAMVENPQGPEVKLYYYYSVR